MGKKIKTDTRIELGDGEDAELWNLEWKQRTVFAHLVNDKEKHELGKLEKCDGGWTFEGADKEGVYKNKQEAAEAMLEVAPQEFVATSRTSMLNAVAKQLPLSLGTRIRGVKRALLASDGGGAPDKEFEDNIQDAIIKLEELRGLMDSLPMT